MQKKKRFLFAFSNESTFNTVKGTKKREGMNVITVNL